MAYMLLSKTYWIVGVTIMNDVQQVMKIKMGMPWTNFKVPNFKFQGYIFSISTENVSILPTT